MTAKEEEPPSSQKCIHNNYTHNYTIIIIIHCTTGEVALQYGMFIDHAYRPGTHEPPKQGEGASYSINIFSRTLGRQLIMSVMAVTH